MRHYNDIEAVRSLVNDKTCAIMLEMVQGEGGVLPADPDFVKQLCRAVQRSRICF